jgi:hypothetical protein
MHPIQPMVEEVVIPIQSPVNPTLLLEGDASYNHVISISHTTLLEQETILLSLITLPSNIGEVPFDWDGLVGYPIPPPMPFQVRDVIQYIMDKVTSTSTLCSLAWRALGFPNLVSIIHNMLTFHRNLAQEPWPPP